MTFRSLVLCVLMFGITGSTLCAQTTDTISVKLVKAKNSFEFIAGVASIRRTYEYYPSEPADARNTASQHGYSPNIGIGGHVPLLRLAENWQLWAVPQLLVQWQTETGVNGQPDQTYHDVVLPLVATISYGAVRPSRHAWFGVEAGLGVNLGWRSSYQSLSVAPCAVVDVYMMPKQVFRLRFLTDILPAAMSGSSTLRSWTISAVLGYPDLF